MQRVGVNMVLFLHAARGELFATLDRGFHSDRIRRVKGWFRFSPRGANTVWVILIAPTESR